MPNKPTLLYWDSCVFISAIQQTAERYPTLKAILDLAATEKVIIVTSALTIAEVIKLDVDNAAPDQLATDAAMIRCFFENDFIAVRNVDRLIAERAGEFVRKHTIKPPDAIHLATAAFSKCSCLQTYDRPLLRLDGQIGWPALSIKTPSHPEGKSGPTLF
jgi:predicted nucleic acid-binding protein